MEDKKIIELFFERNQQAVNALAEKYGKLCLKISFAITGNACDAEECVNDAYLAVWNKIPPENPKPLSAYLCRIVRNLSINRFKSENTDKRNSQYALCFEEVEELLSNSPTPEDEIVLSELTEHINKFLSKLSKTNRIIFVRRFWYMDDYKEISARVGFSEGNVRTRLSRTKTELKKYLIKQGVSI